MSKDNLTIDDLAAMIKTGFDATAQQKDMDSQFVEVNRRLDRIENKLLTQHNDRITALELEFKDFKDRIRL